MSVTMRSESVQRLRATFGVDGPLRYISVLDMGRLWERLLRRAGVPLAYTQGFNPHPRLQFASALPVGYSSECELLDLWLAERMEPAEFAALASDQAPLGLTVLQVEEVPLKVPAPQALVRAAHYQVRLWAEAPREDVERALGQLLARPSIPRQRQKKGHLADYDLRPLIQEIRYLSSEGGCHELYMILRAGAEGSGRPEEVVDALGLPGTQYTIHRVRLIWGDQVDKFRFTTQSMRSETRPEEVRS